MGLQDARCHQSMLSVVPSTVTGAQLPCRVGTLHCPRLWLVDPLLSPEQVMGWILTLVYGHLPLFTSSLQFFCHFKILSTGMHLGFQHRGNLVQEYTTAFIAASAFEQTTYSYVCLLNCKLKMQACQSLVSEGYPLLSSRPFLAHHCAFFLP